MGIGAGGSVGERGGEGNGEGGEGGEGSEGGIASPHGQICVRLPVLLEQTDAQIDGGGGEGGGGEGGGGGEADGGGVEGWGHGGGVEGGGGLGDGVGPLGEGGAEGEGGGGAEGGGAATTMIGADSTMIPSAVVAAVAVGRAAESVASTWVEVLESGTAMVAVTITDAAVTAMLTACG